MRDQGSKKFIKPNVFIFSELEEGEGMYIQNISLHVREYLPITVSLKPTNIYFYIVHRRFKIKNIRKVGINDEDRRTDYTLSLRILKKS